MTQPDEPGPGPSPAPAGDFSLNISDDLLAEALAAVEARSRPSGPSRPADANEMAAFEADLEIDAPEAGAWGDDFDGDDGAITLFTEADTQEEDPLDPPSGADPSDSTDLSSTDAPITLDGDEDPEATLVQLQGALDGAFDPADDLEARLDALSAELDAERQEKLRLAGLARRWKERAERAEARILQTRESRDAAEERALRAEAAVALGEEQKDEALRRAAERRRKEIDAIERAAPGKVIKPLLPILDNLLLALGHHDQDADRVVEGIAMIAGQFQAALARLGVEAVESAPGTPFSPDRHEALSQEPHDRIEAGAVLSEVTPGYFLDGRLLRAARVIVSAGPVATAAPDPDPPAAAPDAQDAPDTPDADSDGTGEASP